MPIIECHKLSKVYKRDLRISPDKTALDQVTFMVGENEVYGIIGPNGAGKSTILKILLGFVRPTGGSFNVGCWQPASSTSPLEIGFLPENPSLYRHLTIHEHLEFLCRITRWNKGKSSKKISEILEKLKITFAQHRKIKHCSKGMSQRAALACALILDPSIVILDEPMSGLDPIGRKLVLDIILELKNSGKTILFCSHILTDVEQVCDRIGILHQGKLLNEIDSSTLFPESAASVPKPPNKLETFFLNSIREANE